MQSPQERSYSPSPLPGGTFYTSVLEKSGLLRASWSRPQSTSSWQSTCKQLDRLEFQRLYQGDWTKVGEESSRSFRRSLSDRSARRSLASGLTRRSITAFAGYEEKHRASESWGQTRSRFPSTPSSSEDLPSSLSHFYSGENHYRSLLCRLLLSVRLRIRQSLHWFRSR